MLKSRTEKAISRAFSALISTGARRATVYLDANYTVKATHVRKPTRRDRYVTVIVTAGVPNYKEREFIRRCKRAGEPFPVRKVQLDFWPKPRKKK